MSDYRKPTANILQHDQARTSWNERLRRRAYLKKASQANFEGICSGDITVMRAKDGLIPELLPFIVNNEKFFDYAITHSAGGLSPRVKFKDLSKYEFLLPSNMDQMGVLELLVKSDRTLQMQLGILDRLEILRDTSREKLFTYGIQALDSNQSVELKKSKCGLIREDIAVEKFFNCVDICSGQVDPKNSAYSGLYQIGSERIEPNTGRITELKTAKELEISSGNYLFTEEDVIYSKIRPYFKKVANPNFTGLCSADIYPLRPKTEILSKDFLFYYLLTEKFTRRLLRFQNRTGMPKVNREELGSMYIPVPKLEEQLAIVETLKTIDDSIDQAIEKISALKNLQKSLIRQVF